MEQKHVLLSALSVGVGVGVGLGLVSGSTVGRWTGGATYATADAISGDQIELELLRLLVDGKESKVTFEDFPYYLSERARVLLTSAAYVHLKHLDVSKHTRNLSPASRAILLSGPAELYQQMLAKALAHHFEAKLLLLDINDFSLKMQSKYGITKKDSSLNRSISESTIEKMSSLFGSFLPYKDDYRDTLSGQRSGLDATVRNTEGINNSLRPRRTSSVSSDTSSSISAMSSSSNPAPSKRVCSWSFDEKDFLQSLYKVLVSVSRTSGIILYIRDAEKLFLQSSRLYKLFDKMLKRLTGSVLVLGSRILDTDEDSVEVNDKLSLLFSYNIEIRPPEDEARLTSWKSQLEEDIRKIQFQDNKNHIAEVLAANDLECDDLGSICHADSLFLSNYIDEIVVSAISYHLMNNKDPEYRNGKLVISSKSLSHGLSVFQEGRSGGKYTLKMETNAECFKDAEVKENAGAKTESKPEIPKSENKSEAEKSNSSTKTDGENALVVKPVEVPPDNEFEKRIRPEVIPANEIGVTFSDIGALDEIKESLQELVMLPLRRPDLFNGGLLKPCRGILLFGPPGTGKTMLAKAIANEAGASFINVSMSTITSKWFGEDEKNVRALFTLAAKVSPTIIFVDEVDSMLGQRTRVGEQETMRKIKNEFVTHWDGLLTKPGERILVLAATNRPFDLDEAIIRRFERRIMGDLPSVENREMILRTLMSKEKVEDLDFKEIAVMTEGYSGSDLKNLCITAAYRPVRELIQQERQKDKQKKLSDEEECESSKDAAASSAEVEETKDEKVISLRPLNMEDIRQAKNQVAASFASEGSIMGELKQWNELYGEGGSRKKQQLSYFL
ncbi:PREDICTED: ribosome biogenesis ATPase RIX7 [Erythranthe guttata]|uniref:ribosome biogenesis ATPase RIX7 n=1 Tax=Erythranthe guttata TaxID=4155 RepID=UPI00064D9AF5|nr:PREDICTED: ribosome biogenesis ATPase RIX7 [Erythranthe guttata]|eukprot:XP_012852095.1 PREDICTED: ribosome biogenesis ATPase RIX7 [Erythranthe guttata]